MIKSNKANGGREKKGKGPGAGNWKKNNNSSSNIKSRAKRKSLIPEGQEIWNPVTKSWEIEKPAAPTNTKPERDRRPGSQRNVDNFSKDNDQRDQRPSYGTDRSTDNRGGFRNDRSDSRGGYNRDNDRRNDRPAPSRDNDRRSFDNKRTDNRFEDRRPNNSEYTSKQREEGPSFKSGDDSAKTEGNNGWRSKWEEFELKDTETSRSRGGSESRNAGDARPRPASNRFGNDRSRSNSGRPEGRRNDSRGGDSRGNDRRKSNSKKFKGSDIHISQLVQKAVPIKEQPAYVPEIPFADFPVDKRIRQALDKRGYENPTEIQDRTIKATLSGQDVMGIAQTGTGKTAAFLIPIIDMCLKNDDPFTALIMVPTRELALQVQDEFYAIAKGMRLFAEKFIGGTSLRVDFQRLNRRPHVVIGTPGRLVDLTNRGDLPLEQFSVLVLDEFDRMLDMGFSHDVMYIADRMTNRKQNMLFSATIDGSVKKLVDNLLNDPAQIKVSSGQSTSENVEQDVVRTQQGGDKLDTLVNMLEDPEFERVILFAETRHKVSKLSKQLGQRGISADEIHGDKTQNARQKALDKFKQGRVQVLVATDVAARGIDVTNVSHVINYEIPRTYDSYVHRIGRTGRAGKAGVALTFVD